MSNLKVLVIGGDGFCGWLAALHLSSLGHDIVIVDNMSRREIDIELEIICRYLIMQLTAKQIDFIR